MTIQNLLNEIKLDKSLLAIIICLAAAALITVIVVIACGVRASKKRKAHANLTEIEHSAEENTEANAIVEEKNEQSVSQAEKDAVAETFAEKIVNKTDAEQALTEAELDELSAVNEDGAGDADEDITVQLSDENNVGGSIVYRTIRYNRSFLARITQASDEVKERYSVLKNYLLSYANVKSTLSWKRERFSIGRVTFACFVMRGKKICLCFATDPKRFVDTKYKVVDLSERSPKNKLPCKYRITSDRRVTYAKEILDMLLAELSVEKLADYFEQNYTMPYRETDALIEDGLIKIKIIEGLDNTANDIYNVEQIKNIVKQTEQLPKRDFKILKQVEATEVNVMSDAQAANLIEHKVVKRKNSKGAKGIINIDVLSKKFPAGALVNIDTLHEMRVIPNNVNSIKVLAKGVLDKPLIIEADDFSLQAVKMIALTGGRAIRINAQ